MLTLFSEIMQHDGDSYATCISVICDNRIFSLNWIMLAGFLIFRQNQDNTFNNDTKNSQLKSQLFFPNISVI